MKKSEYLQMLLHLCTNEQVNLFDNMYPDGPSKSQLSWATRQVETTLRNANKKTQELKDTIKQHENQIQNHDTELSSRDKIISELKIEITNLNIRINQLSTPETEKTAAIQEKLDLLEALEIGGVDNWEWYSESITYWENNQQKNGR